MYSNKILNFQESTTILDACTKKSGNSLNASRILEIKKIVDIKTHQTRSSFFFVFFVFFFLGCPVGKFGEKCQKLCHCNDPNLCNNTDGRCSDNKCKFGYRGQNCQERTSLNIEIFKINFHIFIQEVQRG